MTIRDISDTQIEKGYYHIEYTNIHNHRLQLVRLIHLWRQIGIPGIIVSFVFIARIAIRLESAWILIFGLMIGIAISVLVHRTTLAIDKAVRSYYARIVFLEMLLDFHFFRDYLWKNYKELMSQITSNSSKKDIEEILSVENLVWKNRSSSSIWFKVYYILMSIFVAATIWIIYNGYVQF